MYKNGGYAIVSHNDANIYSKVQGAFANQKPILFYDDDNTCYYIDTIKKNNDGDYVLTKGGKTFVVTSNNTLSSEGDVVQHLYLYNIYLDGNRDFSSIITLPFDIGSFEVNDADSFTANKDKLQKIYNFMRDDTHYPTMSADSSIDVQQCYIQKTATILRLRFDLVKYSDGSDETKDIELAVVDGILSGLTSGSIEFSKITQLI